MSRLRLAALPVIAAVATLAALAPGTAAYAAPTLTVGQPTVAPGVVRFLLTAQDLPEGQQLDPTKVRVSVDASALSVKASEVDRSVKAEELPPRGLVVVMDLSGSFEGPPLDSAKSAALRLADDLPPDVKLGLVTVADTARAVVDPTVDRTPFKTTIGTLKAAGNTALRDGVSIAASRLAEAGFTPGSEQRVLVFSDGADNRSTTTLEQLAQKLKVANLPVDSVAFKADQAGKTQLNAYAAASGGRTLPAESADAIAAGFRAAGQSFSVYLAVEATVPDELAGTTTTLKVSVEGFSPPLSTLVPNVKFAGLANPPAATIVPTLKWVPNWLAFALGGVIFLAVLIVVLSLVWPKSAKQERIRQISNFGPAARAHAAPKRDQSNSAGGVVARTALAATASMMRSRSLEQRIAMRLDQAGMSLKPHEWVLLRVCVMITAGAMLFLVASWVGVFFGLVIGWLFTMLYRLIRVERRTQTFADQLPDVLQLVVGSLRSGFSLPQAFDAMVRESAGIVAAEFGRAMAEQRLGADISDALERAAARTRSEDLQQAVIAVRIQREVGGNLAEVLQNTVDTMRERGRLRRHVRALSAEGRLSAWILIGLPIVLATFMYIFRRAYLRPLVTERLGITMLLVGLVLFVVGIIWMTRVIRVDA